MKFGIAQRLALLLAVTGVLASGLTGYYAYSNSRALLVQAAQERMQTAVNVLARQLTVSVDSTARDVRMLAGHPRVGQALQTSHTAALGSAKDEAATLFVALLETRPEYFQVRLISVADHGMEQVRVDRDLASLLRIPAADLQEKGHYPYVFETLRLTPGEIYVSSPTINHEMGAHAGQGKPTLQLAAPVHDGQLLLGVVVINVDMNYIFSQIAADLPRDLGFTSQTGWAIFWCTSTASRHSHLIRAAACWRRINSPPQKHCSRCKRTKSSLRPKSMTLLAEPSSQPLSVSHC